MGVLSRGLGLVRQIMFHCQFSVHLVLYNVSVIVLAFVICVCVCMCTRGRERERHTYHKAN